VISGSSGPTERGLLADPEPPHDPLIALPPVHTRGPLLTEEEPLPAEPLGIQPQVRALAPGYLEALERGVPAPSRRAGALDQRSYRRIQVGVRRQRVALDGGQCGLRTRLLGPSLGDPARGAPHDHQGAKHE
jgi:hypothetical protein